MTQGYGSDVEGDDTVMNSKQVSVGVHLEDMPPQEAMLLAQQAGFDNLTDKTIATLVRGEQPERGTLTFDLPYEKGLEMLVNADVIDVGGANEMPEEIDMESKE